MSVRVINYNYFLNVTDYVSVNFEQMASIVDYLGGVTVDIDEDEARYMRNYEGIHVGECHLDGEAAVTYSRIRQSSATDSDKNRTGRQREVLLSIMETARQMPLNRYPGFIRDCLGMCATSFDSTELLELAVEVMAGNYAVEQYFFPEEQVEWWGGIIQENFYYVYDLRRASDRMYRIIYEELYISGYDD